MRHDLAIIGGGLVGLATAHAWLERRPGTALILLEKEASVALHQSSRNSGVIHSGIYYNTGSLKAVLCAEGSRRMLAFCREHGIAHAVCGKVIVATREGELPGLQKLYERGRANGVKGLALVGPERLKEIEPHAAGLRALHVPSAGIADYPAVAKALAERVRRGGGVLRLEAAVCGLQKEPGGWRIQLRGETLRARALINCAGLHADRVAAFSGAARDVQIIPFRGEYYALKPERAHLVRSMIYPVPDPAFPFLGVHFTRDVYGGVHAGPNAVLALKREGYLRRDVDLAEIARIARFPGFWKLAGRHWRMGCEESWRSFSKGAFVRALQRLVPEVQAQDLEPAPSGVRAQALDRQGRLLDDFSMVQAPGAIHVRNVPSPAATACLAVGQKIVEMAQSLLDAPHERE